MFIDKYITRKQIEEMVRNQLSLNNKTNGENWTTGTTNKGRNIDWLLCMQVETIEYIDSFNWKHWQDINSKDNIKNARMELVDIWHFFLSEALRRESDVNKVVTFIEDNVSQELIFTHLTPIDNAKEFIRELSSIDAVMDDDSLDLIYSLHITFLKLVFVTEGFDLKELYKLYMIKNVLNTFRQDNGYMAGTYIKEWKFNDVCYEDNEYIEANIDTGNGISIYEQIDNMYKAKEN